MHTATIDDPNMRSYTFTEGQPFTQYNVRVDGVVELNGQEAQVVALTSTPLRTAEGGESFFNGWDIYSYPLMPSAASAPENLQVTDVGITEATFSWSVPASPNGIISEYLVRGLCHKCACMCNCMLKLGEY